MIDLAKRGLRQEDVGEWNLLAGDWSRRGSQPERQWRGRELEQKGRPARGSVQLEGKGSWAWRKRGFLSDRREGEAGDAKMGVEEGCRAVGPLRPLQESLGLPLRDCDILRTRFSALGFPCGQES